MKFLSDKWIILMTLFLIVLVAYGQTIQMYFLIDDNALIYKLQHLEQNIGFFGKGIFGEGPYRHMVDQFIPFYPFFGVNPIPYFAVGVFLYFLSAVTIYFFVNSLTKNKILSVASASIFAAGYIGSESMFGIINSWQSARGLIMAILTLLLFYKYIKSKNLLYYLLAIILFFFSLDTVYIRAHGLVFSIFVFDLLFWPVAFKFREIIAVLARQAPFVFIHYYVYLSSTQYAREMGMLHLLKDVFVDKKYFLATIPFQDIGNLFIPSILTSRIDKIFSQYLVFPAEFSLGSFLAGIFILFLFFYLILKNFRKEELLTKILVFGFLFAVFNFIVFWLRETGHTLGTTHRYFFYSLAGVSLFWATSFYLQGKIFNLSILILVIILLWLGTNYQREFNMRRSFPAKDFFTLFHQAIPTIPKDSVIYFNIANDNQTRVKFASFFGGMFSEGSNLAIYSPNIDYMKDFKFTYKFEDIFNKLNDRSTSLDKIFTFYYGKDGLVNTSERTREILSKGAEIKLPVTGFSSNTAFEISQDTFMTETTFRDVGGNVIGENPVPVFTFGEDVTSLIPSKLIFSLAVNPKVPSLPYQSKSGESRTGSLGKSKIFAYLVSRNSFRESAVATSASFWKKQEPKLALDSRLETAWRGHRGFWNDIAVGKTKNTEYFIVDLKKMLTVNQVKWVSSQRPLVPIHYRILTSSNGRQWNLAKEVKKVETLPEGTAVFDSFSPVLAQFVKMEILKTYGNDGPELKEFEVVESSFSDLVQEDIERVENEPFGEINNVNDYEDALAYVKQNALMRVYYISSADSKQDPTRYVDVPLFIDGNFYEYSVLLPATGQTWVRLTINGFNFPAKIRFKDPIITYERAHSN